MDNGRHEEFSLFFLFLIMQSVSADERQDAFVKAMPIVEWVKKLISLGLNWEEKFQVEEKLQNMASEQVFLALIPKQAKKCPPRVGWLLGVKKKTLFQNFHLPTATIARFVVVSLHFLWNLQKIGWEN